MLTTKLSKKMLHLDLSSKRLLAHNDTADPNNLPTEMLEKILKLLNYKDLCQAELVCRRWRETIRRLKKKASGKIGYSKSTMKGKSCYTYYTLNCFHLSLTGMISCIILAEGAIVEVLTGEFGTKKLPNLPSIIISSTMVMHNETILICGGSYFNSRMSNTTKKECLQLSNGSWLKHSVFNDERIYHSTVTTQTSTFVFGGRERDIIS